MSKLVRILIGGMLLVSLKAYAVQSVLWDKTAIRINLVVGVEQMIHFPHDAQIGLPGSLANPDIFVTLFASKTAYWKALQPFESQRIQARMSTGEIILFDVTATVEKSPPKSVEALNIVPSTGNDTPDSGEPKARERATIFEVLRYAAQMTYSPLRLVEPLEGVRETPISTSKNLNAIYNHKDHPGLVFIAKKSWTVDGLHVTAISVINQHTHSITLDNRLVRHTQNADLHGVERHFIASSFFHHKLSARNKKGDRTHLYIVTDKPLHSVLRL